jgi:hypothetical protein
MSEEHEIEVMPERDVTKVRVQLKESFSGIPLPLTSKTKQKKIDKAHAHYKLAVGMDDGHSRSCRWHGWFAGSGL